MRLFSHWIFKTNIFIPSFVFFPLVVETFGGWDADAVKLLKEIAHQDARRWGKDPSIEIKHFFQRLSVSLQRGNAALLIDRDREPLSA